MQKTIVVYYSKKGNNRFLAKKVAQKLQCDTEELKPRLNAQLPLLMGISFGNKKIQKNISDYDRVILCGPIWMGKFIAPLKNFVKTHKEKINKLVFITCCGSSYEYTLNR